MNAEDEVALQHILKFIKSAHIEQIPQNATNDVLAALHLIEVRKANEHLKSIARSLDRLSKGKPPFSGPG